MANPAGSNKISAARADKTAADENISGSKFNRTKTVIQTKPVTRMHFYQALAVSIGLGLVIACFFLYLAPTFCDWGFSLLRSEPLQAVPAGKDVQYFRQQVRNLAARNISLINRLKNMVPRAPYLIIDTSENQFYLKRGNRTIRQGVCSTGSYTLLKTIDDDQQWIFKTPRGIFRIQGKIVSPTWRMPDWAFIEEGRPVPPQNSPERYERGVLGDYALALGDGYLIHGTLYQRFLGLAVTHGCVRLGDDDLKAVFKHLELGSKVFIY